LSTHPMRARWRTGLVFALLVLGIWTPRGLALDRFVTADEPKWLARSGNFYLALSRGDWAHTFTREHPGVMTTWAGALGLLWRFPEYTQQAPGYLTDSRQVEPVIRESGRQPVDVLEAGRVVMVVMITLALVGAFALSIRLVGLGPAALGFALIAFDPFQTGLSRLLHLDGLMSSLVLLSLLAFLNALKPGSRRAWGFFALSGAAAGLAWLTKSPAFFLVPFVVLLLGLDLVIKWLAEKRVQVEDLWRAVRAGLIWGLAGGAVFVALWPAMWVSPLGTLRQVFAEANTYAEEGHSSEVYFRGAVIGSDPERTYSPVEQHLYGPWAKVRIVGDEGRLFYPLAYLWRTTPAVLAGLVLAALSLLAPRKGVSGRDARKVIETLGLFALFFGLFMTLGSKKFDRYLLPVFAPLDLVAGLGWTWAAGWVIGKARPGIGRYTVFGLLGLVIGVQAWSAVRTSPYYLSYYDPVMGGSHKAPEVMMIGWGEGLDQAARYLNAKPGAETMKVLSWYPDGSFSYLFNGETVDSAPEWEQTRARLFDADYAVVYIHQWQRQLPFSEMLAYFADRTPEAVIRINGIEYAQIYRMGDAASP
jgi:hypothetical protein